MRARTEGHVSPIGVSSFVTNGSSSIKSAQDKRSFELGTTMSPLQISCSPTTSEELSVSSSEAATCSSFCEASDCSSSDCDLTQRSVAFVGTGSLPPTSSALSANTYFCSETGMPVSFSTFFLSLVMVMPWEIDTVSVEPSKPMKHCITPSSALSSECVRGLVTIFRASGKDFATANIENTSFALAALASCTLFPLRPDMLGPARCR
mmetsp:Transcript_94030/g.146949  ORF Transcript_94030/g.146949 Transcript_94030/m.146949 type:complete len:207 (-) Transcript_94030:48-668(-)